MLKRIVKSSALVILSGLFIFASPFDFNLKLLDEFIPREKKISERGLYITGSMAKSSFHFNRIKEEAKKCGLNTLVIDAKWFLEKPLLKLAKERKLSPKTTVSPDLWLAKLIAGLHEEGFILTARIVVFKDDHLAMARPDLAVKRKDGGLYRDRKGGRWVDPYGQEVRLYNELIAESAALCGFDEIQFDYIRFPAEASAHQALYPFEQKELSRVEIINSFLKEVRERTKKYQVSLAVDIFGVTAWQSKNDIKNLGQDLKSMAPYIDVLSPMFYPSHFHAGYDGFANPGSHPFYFVNTGIRKAKEILSNEAVAIVPWIQGFNLSSPNFGPNYILEQIRGAKEEGVDRYLIWNARNDYWATFAALQKK